MPPPSSGVGGLKITEDRLARLRKLHAEAYNRQYAATWRRWASTGQGARGVTRDQVRHAKPDPDLFVIATPLVWTSHELPVIGDRV